VKIKGGLPAPEKRSYLVRDRSFWVFGSKETTRSHVRRWHEPVSPTC